MPNGRDVAYVSVGDRASIMVQPLDGKAAYPLTRFSDGAVIGDFRWSRDGRQLAVVRAVIMNDVVLLRNLPIQ